MDRYKNVSNDNFRCKLELEKSGAMFNDVLELFPSGIVFYNNVKGAFYRNKCWNKILESIKNSCNFEFMNRSKSDYLDEEPEFKSPETPEEKCEVLFIAMIDKENNSQSLNNLIQKVHSMVVDSDVKEINNYDEMIERYNNSFNEYEIKDTSGKVIKEFSIKVRPINTISGGQSLMIVFNDISERSRLKESRISE
jgi:hypothetical protein